MGMIQDEPCRVPHRSRAEVRPPLTALASLDGDELAIPASSALDDHLLGSPGLNLGVATDPGPLGFVAGLVEGRRAGGLLGVVEGAIPSGGGRRMGKGRNGRTRITQPAVRARAMQELLEGVPGTYVDDVQKVEVVLGAHVL